ncbi:MAG: class I SAM-dependent RNA methyltransferase [Polyangiaceae bacterium]|nr:class I SAM-dependent RNA methyltransferase [Polyangiaceae bacterium]
MSAGAAPPLVECPHAPACGGCPWIGVDAAEQLARKRARVAAELARYPELGGVEVAEVVPSPSVADFRVRAKLVAAPGARLGLYAREGHVVVDVPECRVLHPALRAAATAVRRLGASAHAPEALVASSAEGGALLAVDLRRASREGADRVLVTLILDEARVPGAGALAEAARALREADATIATVAVATRAAGSARVLGAAPRVIAGPAQVPDDAAGIVHLAVPGGFVQSNAAQARQLAEAVRAQLTEALGGVVDRHVVDAFAGAGALGVHLAAAGARVTAVESHPMSAAAARAAPGARLQVMELPAAVALAALAREHRRVDAVIVDPPRRGLEPATRDALAQLGPSAVAYVSCSPVTLARDLAHLARLGLRVTRVTPLDMMPHTSETEALALVLPGARAAPRVYGSAAGSARDQPPHDRPVPGAAGARSSSLPPQVSGLVAEAWRAPAEHVEAAWLLGVRGRAPRGGALRAGAAVLRFRRLAALPGVSLLGVVSTPDPGARALLGRFAAAGWPVVGAGTRDAAATDRHCFERHALDRAFAHRAGLRPAGGDAAAWITSPLAADLAAVVESLEAPASEAAAEPRRAGALQRLERWVDALRRRGSPAL